MNLSSRGQLLSNITPLTRGIRSYLSEARVARLATVNQDGTAQLVPVVFANDSKHLFFVIDKKEKGKKLRRIENIIRRGRATLLVDRYSENWSNLSFVMIYAKAKVLGKINVNERRRASYLLKRKYKQYSTGGYFPDKATDATFVILTPVKIARWSQILRYSVI